MNNMQAAAEDIKKLAAYLNGLITFAADLEKMGSLQQAAKESESRIESSLKKEKAAIAGLEKAESDLVLITEKAQGILDDAKYASLRETEKAKEHAQAIVLGAKKDSEAIFAAAQNRKMTLEVQVQSLQEKRAAAQVEVESVLAVLNPLKEELAALKAKLGV